MVTITHNNNTQSVDVLVNGVLFQTIHNAPKGSFGLFSFVRDLFPQCGVAILNEQNGAIVLKDLNNNITYTISNYQ